MSAVDEALEKFAKGDRKNLDLAVLLLLKDHENRIHDFEEARRRRWKIFDMVAIGVLITVLVALFYFVFPALK